MSVSEPVSHPKKLISFDRIVLVVTSVLLLSHAGLYYVCLRYDLLWMFVANFMMAVLIGKLPLPDNIALAIIDNFFTLVVGGYLAVVLTVRFIKLKTLKSPALLSSAALLIAYNFGGSDALDYVFDQIRFQMNREIYLSIAKSSDGWPESAVIKWGNAGFLDSSVQYFLVFDRAGVMASGAVKPETLVSRSEHMKCGGPVRRLSRDFYSVTVWCVGT